jgi:hypothetical protein
MYDLGILSELAVVKLMTSLNSFYLDSRYPSYKLERARALDAKIVKEWTKKIEGIQK